jgi:lipopolysaccharide export system ATP-binding protein
MLQIQGITKSYNGRCVVKNVKMNIDYGQVVGLLGPNGSGKTTCFNIIAGLALQDEGTILLDNKDITKLPVYKRARMGLCYLPQEPSVFQKLSCQDNILAALELQKLTKSAMREELDKILVKFRISNVRKSKAADLSGGERRRLEIARTIALNPKLILLDEPFVGIDPIAIKEIKEIIIELKKQGLSFLITDHSVYQALQIIDICYIIYNGSILIGDTKEKVINNQAVKNLYLGEDFTI